MLFNSPLFLYLLLPIFILIYLISPRKIKNLLLLLFSILFYFFSSPEFTLTLLASILINYFLVLLIVRSKKTKFKVFVLAVVFNLSVLFYYKYLGFFVTSLFNPLGSFLSLPQIKLPTIILPLALSFYTFHALSYLIDTYKNKINPTKNLIDFGLYFTLFPHLIAGPIVRFGEIVNDLKKRTINSSDFSYGVRRFITGLAKKVLIADIVGQVVDEIFAIPPQNMSWESAWFGVICFTIQIYFDFSGYSDMAIGLARMFGFKFPENFNYPYISTSIGEFWQRWHMTLSRWFKDYVYIPLGGNRQSYFRNILIVFFLTGLWHGAGWNFIVWGVLQGLFILFERFKKGVFFNFLPKAVKYLYFLLALTISWVIFRSENLSYSISYLNRLLFDFSRPQYEYRPFAYFLNNERLLAVIVGVIISTSILQKLAVEATNLRLFNNSLAKFGISIVHYSYFIALLMVIMTFVAGQTFMPFLYFKF